MRGTTLTVAVCASLAGCAGPTYDTSPPFVPDSPSVYVAKVKNILVGLAPTDAEVAAVTADPTALTGLIKGWMALPEYQNKMMVFFELAFQQTQIGVTDFVDSAPPNGIGKGTQLPLLVQNARESFARTVLGFTSDGQPLTTAFTTKQVMMTPALMQMYAYFDAHRADDNAKVTDSFAKQNPKLMITLEASDGPIPIAESLDPNDAAHYMHFYNPELPKLHYSDSTCDGQDPVSINGTANNLWDIMYGVIPAHQGPGSKTNNCQVKNGDGTGWQLSPSDYTTWNLITVRPPNAGESTTNFYDLPTLRTTNELVLGTPHPGFFGTPAFQANWPTNSSNQMRVTTNQTLIVATGTAVDGTDGTTPSTTPGLDMKHAAPGSACFSCHQLLDPTRSILSYTYSWFYVPQTDPLYDAQPGLFAFQGVIAPMQTIDDFANILASHPLVASAWAQKLCYYANSAPCDPTDPVFQKIVADFGNGFDWNSLITELLASPITTNASATKTNATNGEVIAVTRRDHLCAALNNRLGFVDICQLDESDQTAGLSTIAQIVSGMPSDGYGRGATIPVLPNQPTLFYRGGAENICAQVSQMVIDATLSPDQPGAKQWSSSQPAAAINDFVAIVDGLTPSDPRAALVNAALTDHFTTAKQQGYTATDALRSTFVAACLSPSFIGIGM